MVWLSPRSDRGAGEYRTMTPALPPLITLTTDFGTQDWFVGTMKGVILRICPGVQIVDITHGIPPGDIRSAAFALASSCRYFPPGAIHVVVVDPGVGTRRAALAIETDQYVFVGPDNGVLAPALDRVRKIHRLENVEYFLKPVSRTFHGRDVFAPCAAHLARGVSIGEFGPASADYEKITVPAPLREENRWVGEVLYIDQFGNAITNLSEALPVFQNARQARVSLIGRPGEIRLADAYQAAAEGEPVAVLGSTGYLEIAVNGGSAAQVLAVKRGDVVFVRDEDQRR